MNNPKKILLLQLMSNGDCLYATAIARQIKQDYPGCHLTWAVASFCKGILDNNPYVDTIWEIPDVSKHTCHAIVRQLRKQAEADKLKGIWDEVFFTQIIDDNQANYDGTIRSSIFRGYGKPITVPVTPVLQLMQGETDRVTAFAAKYKLAEFKNVILFEFAPQSGQLAITPAQAIQLAEDIVKNESTAIILSSNIKIGDGNPKLIDGSLLTLRETAALTHYCTLLLGCSSGITWISTSSAAKHLPMVQMLDPYALWVNPISSDFKRCGFSTDTVIEIYDKYAEKIPNCIADILNSGISFAKQKYSTPLPLHFKTTRVSIYNMLCYLQIGAIARHIKINVGIYGWNATLIKEIAMGIFTFPYKLIRNTVKKRLLKK